MVNADIAARTKELTPESDLKNPETLERNETVRIEQFSDGVFAIAITLLVLGINVPKANELGADGSLGLTLIKMWPHYLAFVTSFITILAKWVNHHRIFSFIQKTDHTFLYWNGLLLLFITFMPFPTTLLAEYLLHPQAKIAGAVFAGTYVAIAFAFRGLWNHASKNGRLLAQNVDDREILQITRQYQYGPLLYLAAFALSFVSVGLSVCMCLCLAVFFAFKGWPTLRAAVLFIPPFSRKR
ncbi:MAG: TMEM175 family protein [Thermodesulfovibrionia bacterium]|nr:TMEM175 family protein [Thermodesulfovibrionia bacterium]